MTAHVVPPRFAPPCRATTRPVIDQATAERSGKLRILLALSFALLLLPPALAPIPPLWDYPNHLARLWLLGGGGDLPTVAGWYRITWDSLTNVALDALAAQIVPWIGYMASGRLLVTAAIVLPPLGGVVLWRTLHGRWHPWLLAFVPLAWSTTLIGGFLNFQVGIGLALLAAAADTPLSRRAGPWWPLLRAVPAAALIGVHLFGFIFYAGLLAGLTIGPKLTDPARTCRRLALLAISLAVPGAAFLLAARNLPGAQVGANPTTLLTDFIEGWSGLATDPIGKLQRLVLAVTTYSKPAAVLTVSTIMATVALSATLRRRTIHAGMLLAAGGFALCYLLVPARLGGTYWIDARFAMMTPLAAMVALRPDLPPLSSRIVTALLFAVACLNTAIVAETWQARQTDVAALAEVLQYAEPGHAILPLQQRRSDYATMPQGRIALLGGSSFRHLPTLALPWRHDFVPTLFAARGKQPVQVTDAMLASAEPEGGELADEAVLRSPEMMASELPYAPYLRNWREHFDYVLVVDADGFSADPKLGDADGLALIADSGFARLYRPVGKGP